jgi:UDP-N-acetylglucosamine 1-carboxyvinyltransferase
MEAVTIFSYSTKKPDKKNSSRPSLYMSHIGGMIKRERKKLHLSQKEFAQRVHTTQKIISLLESGQSNPTLDLLSRVSEALEKNLVIKFT